MHLVQPLLLLHLLWGGKCNIQDLQSDSRARSSCAVATAETVRETQKMGVKPDNTRS